ncbi:MAG: hypothetical protein V4506_02930 [Bacteroidota bacterium]
MIKLFQDKNFEKLLFFVLFSLVLLFLDFQSLFFLQPRSFHFIRQTDSLSFINYYTKTGFNFFNIGNLNLYNGTGKTACEFPIFYYIVALLSKTGIKSYLLLKFLYLIIFFITSFCTYSFIRKKNRFIDALSITFLLFSSTVILYYTLNYIPNYPALCFTLIACIYFLNYIETNTKKDINLSIVFFLFASLLKITFAIYPIACFLYLAVRFFIYKKNERKPLLFFIMSFVVVVIWNFHVVYYNTVNHANYYLTATKPLWSATSGERHEVIDFILNYWLYKYYYQSTIHLFFIVIFLSLIFYKKLNRHYFFVSLLFFLGVTSYFILFFKQFRDHDYYFLEFIPLLFLVFYHSFITIKHIGNHKIVQAILSGIILIISLLSINYAKINLQRRYDKPFEQVSKIAYTLEGMEAKFDSLAISKDAKVLVIPDNTMNGSLYYINRFGYTRVDTTNIKVYIDRSDYILITDSTFPAEIIKKFNVQNMGLFYRGTSLYKINNFKP